MNKPFLFGPSCTKSSTELPQTSASPMVTFTWSGNSWLKAFLSLCCALFTSCLPICVNIPTQSLTCALQLGSCTTRHSPALITGKAEMQNPNFAKGTMSCQLQTIRSISPLLKSTKQAKASPYLLTRKDTGSSQYALSSPLMQIHKKPRHKLQFQ